MHIVCWVDILLIFAIRLHLGADCSIEETSPYLGKSRLVFTETADEMRGEISGYTSMETNDNGQPKFNPWPLIKTVKVRCPSEVLSTGAVLVDLPGTDDINMARSNVSDAHIQDCNKFWVVIAAGRAISDRPANGVLISNFDSDASLRLDSRVLNLNGKSRFDNSCVAPTTSKSVDNLR